MGTHELYMRRAIELARNGAGSVSPNPMVGCVIVHQNRIIGEGWHQRFGGPHAEVEAIRSVKEKHLLPEAVLYVSLEPCAHHGKTPPCADLIIGHSIQEVVIGTIDPNPLVGGKGAALLEEAGIQVTSGVLEQDCRELNKRFITRMEKKRPWILLKWAETGDGFIARSDGSSKWISNSSSRQLVHKLRSEVDAVLVGAGTAATDDPALTVREWQGRNPVRVVIDPNLRLATGLKLFDGSLKTLHYNLKESGGTEQHVMIKLSEENFLSSLLADLLNRNIGSVLVEGGTKTLQGFIDANLWDEAWCFRSPSTFGSGIKAPVLSAGLYQECEMGGDRLQIVNNPSAASC
ncbi:MAG: bifunctional diaminohydroxyphosphoribosylaminopyrimidine deaminase/5-amino-6-(5-phosphoribosylamino)uracil reductase RibD [Bacteroidota bacterium]